MEFNLYSFLTPIVNINFSLVDLKSRTKNFLLYKIEKPDDELMFALILKNLSDRQISINKKLIDFIVKRIDRSYGKIYDFIYKVDELSLKRKKPIDFKIIREILGELFTNIIELKFFSCLWTICFKSIKLGS